jgi:hypothetical protein
MWFILCSKKWGKFIKFGVLLHPKQKYKCRDCGKQFVLNPEKYISEEKKDIIDKLLGVEQHPRENIVKRNCKKCRRFRCLVAKIGEGKIPRATRRTSYSKKRPSKLEIEVDELWGVAQHTAFCGKKVS